MLSPTPAAPRDAHAASVPNARRTTPGKPRRLRRRRSQTSLHLLLAVTTAMPLSGCGLLSRNSGEGPHDTTASYHDHAAMEIEYPEVAEFAAAPSQTAQASQAPHSLEDPSELPALEMSLDEAIQRALQDSPVLRSIGGTLVSTPQTAATIYDPALAHADPQLGVEAALSEFDARYTQQLFWNKVDQPQNVDPGGVTGQFTPSVLQATQATFAGELSKQTATGASFALRHIVNYDRNNQPFRAFPSEFNGYVEAEWRQPLLRGAGTLYNRIAGPEPLPGSIQGRYQGVLIARVNEDVALADFEASVINLVAEVEQAYWDLYTGYRILEANLKGRESALQTFQYQQVRMEVGTGALDELAQAQSQFYQFEAQVQSALGGPEGLYALEQRLRYLIGMAAGDDALIHPTTEPTDTRVVFDWQSALGQALGRRVELRRQRYNVRRREMELYAARLNRRPRLDFVGAYRWRGLGDELIGDGDDPLDNLYGEITGGDYQEWRAGMELDWPIGLRSASNAVAHARLNLNRERSILAETELRISHDLSDAARQIELTHALLETNYNRYVSDLQQVETLRERYREGAENINFLLQAQRQLVTSESEFYRALADYNLALRDLHQQKGSLLAYNQVSLAEGPWAPGAREDAYEAGRFLTPRVHPEKVDMPRPVSKGEFEPSAVQDTTGPEPGADAPEVIAPGQPAPGGPAPALPAPANGESGADAVPEPPAPLGAASADRQPWLPVDFGASGERNSPVVQTAAERATGGAEPTTGAAPAGPAATSFKQWLSSAGDGETTEP